MISIVFDVHAWNHKRHGGPLVRGINRRGRSGLDVLRRAVDIANQRGDALVVAGDLVDSAGPVQPQFAAALRDVLLQANLGAHLLLGNHDMTAEKDHSLSLYEGVGLTAARTVETTSWLGPISGNWDQVYYDQYSAPDEHTLACLVPFHCDIRDERVRDVPLFVGHFGVYDDSFPSWCKRAKGAWHVAELFSFMWERNIRCVALGDWHGRRVWTQQREGRILSLDLEISRNASIDAMPHPTDRIIIQGGALVPTGWDNPGLRGYGTVARWDGERLSWEELPGPRFCVVRSDEEEAAIVVEAAKLGHNLFLRRYYQGDAAPQRPAGLEAYEALPVRIERAVLNAAAGAGYESPRAELERLMSEWLEQFRDDRDALEAHARKYI